MDVYRKVSYDFKENFIYLKQFMKKSQSSVNESF